MRKIHNAFEKLPGYNCFGCSGHNDEGLRMKFFEDGDEIVSSWVPDGHFQGYFGVLHGGIQATMLDEIASWVVFIKLKTSGVTSNMNVRYRKPLLIEKGEIRLRSRLVEMRKNVAEISAEIYDGSGQLCSEATLNYWTFSREKAKSDMYYPDYADFFDKKSLE